MIGDERPLELISMSAMFMFHAPSIKCVGDLEKCIFKYCKLGFQEKFKSFLLNFLPNQFCHIYVDLHMCVCVSET